MNDIFRRLVNGKTTPEDTAELKRMWAEEGRFMIDEAASRLTEPQLQQVCGAIADRIRGVGTMSALETGFLLTIFKTVTPEMSRAEFFKNMETETGISRVQAYRNIGLYECFGEKFDREPGLVALCTCEALKILSSSSVPDLAREEGLEVARRGERLTIKVAKAIRRKHAASAREESTAVQETNKLKQNKLVKTKVEATPDQILWQFADPQVRVVVQRNGNRKPIDAESILLALEAAVERAKREYITHNANQENLQPV